MKILRSLWIIIQLIIVIFLLIGCSKKTTESEYTPTSTFPLTTDSRWEYEGLQYTVPFNYSFLADTIRKEIYRHIIGPDSLPGIDGLTICDDTVITSVLSQVDTLIYRRWLKIDDNKLKEFASDEFHPGNETEPSLYDYPHSILAFPLSGGKAWISWIEDTTLEDKIVVGIEYIELPFEWQYCDVIRSTIRDNISNDTTRSAYEWYSDDGLMRAEFYLGISYIWDDYGVPQDTVRTYEIWELNESDIQP